MFENILNRNAKHMEWKKKKKFQNGPKSFLSRCDINALYYSRTKLRGSVGNAKQSIFYFRPHVQVYLIITLYLGSKGTDRVIRETVL